MGGREGVGGGGVRGRVAGGLLVQCCRTASATLGPAQKWQVDGISLSLGEIEV